MQTHPAHAIRTGALDGQGLARGSRTLSASRRWLWSAAAFGLLLVVTTDCTSRSGRSSPPPPPPPPPCHVDGVFQVHAQRTGSSGSVCNLNDLRELREELTIQRTGFNTAYVHRRGEYAHQANVDPYACAVWTNQTPTHSRQVFGSTVSGWAAYRATVRFDGTLFGTLQLYVRSNNPLVPGCTASFNLAGRRVR